MPSLAPFGQAVSEEKIFLTLANQKKELILAAMIVGPIQAQWAETLVSYWIPHQPLVLISEPRVNKYRNK
jgi:hypothetical protein